MVTPISSPIHSRPSSPTPETLGNSELIPQQPGQVNPLPGRARGNSASSNTPPRRNSLPSSPGLPFEPGIASGQPRANADVSSADAVAVAGSSAGQIGAEIIRHGSSAAISSNAVIQSHVNEVSGLLSNGGLVMLQQGATDGFASLPPEYRDLGMQTARLAGLVTEPVTPGLAMPFPALAPRLEAVAAASSHLVDATKLHSVSAALRQDPQRRSDTLAPHVKQLKDAGRVTAAAVNQMPVAELRANKEVVKEQLTAWADATETLHEHLKAQFGETHPVTVAALEARTEASAIYGKTMVRMAIARLGSGLYNLTVGKAVAGVTRLFGAGN